MTALPAASAAGIWPGKIDSGKFHGLMEAKTPRPGSPGPLLSPTGPGTGSRANRDPAGDRAGGQLLAVERGDDPGEATAFALLAVVPPLGVAPLRPVDRGRRRDTRMAAGCGLDQRDRILDELLGRDRFVEQGVDEGG